MAKMTDISNFMNLVQSMSATEQRDIVDQILAMMSSASPSLEGGKKARESVVATKERPDCPHCHAEAKLGYVVKRGQFDGTQRYYCKSCGKTFVAATNTAFAQTRKDAAVWRKFIQMTISCKSLKACAEECGIAYQTAFSWRHKILNVFKINQDATMMTGRVEIDEMQIPISYKGNHVKGAIGTSRTREHGEDNGLPRKSFRRGSDNKPKSPKQRACVFCMVEDKNKAFYVAVPGVGFMLEPMLEKTLAKHVDKEKALVLADTYNITKTYMDKNNYRSITLLSNTSDNNHDHKPEIQGDLHLQHVNAMHAHIRKFLKPFFGVSTKYLENYLSLYVWIRTNRALKQEKKIEGLSVTRASSADCYISWRELDALPAVPQCA